MVKIFAPKKTPHDFGFREGDSHLVGNAQTKTIKAFEFGGKLLWEKPCLFDGQHPRWREGRGDTPPGVFKLGQVWNDVALIGETVTWDDYSPTRQSYGWITWDLVDLEGHEDSNGRSGICLHGGGSALGWPGSWEPLQELVPTWGCPRMHNAHLKDHVLPLYQQGSVFLSVWQDDI